MKAQPSYKEATIDFLKRKENLEIALEVSDIIPDVKNELWLHFWQSTKLLIDKEFEGKLNWLVEISENSLLLNQWEGIKISRLPWKKDGYPFQISLDLSQENKAGGRHLYIAFAINTELKNLPIVSGLDELKLYWKDFNWTKWNDPNGKGPWQWTDIDLYSKSTLLKLADGDSIQETVASDLLEVFHETSPLLSQINDELAAMKP
jgi:hypothetical protein